MKRRGFIALLGAVIAAATARGQQRAAPHRIGLLMPSTASATTNLVTAFEEGLREHGYLKGRDIVIEYRYSDDRPERIPDLAAGLAQARVAVIVTTTDAVVRTVMQHTAQVAIVMVNTSDPVGSGLVKELAKPGGRVTGLTNLSPEIGGKRIELLKEAIPQMLRVVYLWNPDLAGAGQAYREMEAAARRLRIEIRSAEVRRTEDIVVGFAALPTGPGAGLMVQAPNPLLYTVRKQIADLAIERRMPSMFNRHEYVEAGGLMSYGPNVADMYRRAGAYVDAILKGRMPADLPVQQPTQFDLSINLKSAKACGLTIPPSLVLRANRVVE